MPGAIHISNWDIDGGLAADFDGSLSGLGAELGTSTYNMSEALLALPVFKQENLDNGFQYILGAATSPAVKVNEETLTYLNQGQSYEIKLKRLGDLSEFQGKFLRADSSKIGFLSSEMTRLLRKLLMKFVLARVIRESDDILMVDFKNRSNQHPDDYVAIGSAGRSYLHEIQDDLDAHAQSRFFSSVRQFYMAVVEKCVAKFPFKDPVLQNLAFLNPDMKDSVNADQVVEVARRFPAVIPEEKCDQLDEEFREFQATPASSLPDYKKSETRIDQFWGKVAALENKITGEKLFPMLAKLAISMTVIPNSNADCERTFSMVRKIQTELRSDLDNSTLCSLLSCKINCSSPCFQFKPSDHMLRLAKSATAEYNQSLKE